MNDSIFIVGWVLLGLLSFTITVIATYRNLSYSQSLIWAKIAQAEKELNDKISRISVAELEQTQAGRELLPIRRSWAAEIVQQSTDQWGRATATTHLRVISQGDSSASAGGGSLVLMLFMLASSIVVILLGSILTDFITILIVFIVGLAVGILAALSVTYIVR